MLGTYFVINVEELLQRLALGGHDESDDVHEKARHGVSVQHYGQDPLHRLYLRVVCPFLQLCLELLLRGLIRRVVLVDQAVCILEEGRHAEQLVAARRDASGETVS